MEEAIKKDTEKPMSDKVVKPETEDTNSTTPKAVKKGEFKEKAMEAMKGYYGEGTEITDDNYDGMVETMATDATGLKEKIGKYDSANKNILAMMEDEPELSGILADMSAGAKFSQVLPKYVDMQALMDSKGGDEAMYEENNKARMSNYEKMQAHKASMEANEKKSMDVVKKFMADKKMEGENADAFGGYVAEMIDPANSGDITQQFLESMYYGMNYKKDIAMAEEVGKVGALNAKIEEKTKSEEEIKQGDGMPVINSSDEAVPVKEEDDTFESRFELSQKKKPSIYKRG